MIAWGASCALDESGDAGRTMVMFLSDHGMPLPFAKTALYYHSTRTPWIVRWPGVVSANSVDRHHMISAVDLTPTLLDIAGIESEARFQGRSFRPLLEGQSQAGRDWVILEYNQRLSREVRKVRGEGTVEVTFPISADRIGQAVRFAAFVGQDYQSCLQHVVTGPIAVK